MAAAGLISRYARTLIHSAEAKGYGETVICDAIPIARALLRDQAAPIDPGTFFRVSRNLKLLMADEFCGFTRAPCPIGTFEMMCEGTVSGGPLGPALQRAFAFYATQAPELRFELRRHGELAAIELQVAHPECDPQGFLNEWWFMLWAHMSGWLIGEEVPVVAADFAHARAGRPEEYSEMLSGLCRFSQPQARLLIPARYLERPTVRSRADLNGFLVPKSLDTHALYDGHLSFKSQLKARLREQLAQTQTLPSIEDAAGECHVSSQTLRRRLQAECSSYRLVKEEVRRELALKFLGDAELPIGEVSLRAGFAEPNGLTRALKSWAGLSPLDVRRGAEPALRDTGVLARLS
ncbi:AraC family transcriptional regulator [Solimonas terrae]|uniref:AraC family transcriptional regulator n=1 Tax=Solimonas terrae TaxID=1396819 RepID=A0A6M2BQJ1_9GAMM|nr:AraC family transcriptional regulator ligand-binding domain-containing protein [Solimonas terrae]NGY04876.1 AraC family transcriptional regulator [Solimonas terrae]